MYHVIIGTCQWVYFEDVGSVSRVDAVAQVRAFPDVWVMRSQRSHDMAWLSLWGHAAGVTVLPPDGSIVVEVRHYNRQNPTCLKINMNSKYGKENMYESHLVIKADIKL